MENPTNNSSKTSGSETSEAETLSSASGHAPNAQERDERASPDDPQIALPSHVASSGTLDRLVDTARDYARASTADNTNKAYAAEALA